jgi:hypothetical protein
MANTRETSKPAPLETDDHEQKDDNIDAEGNRAGGGKQAQPSKSDKPADKGR